MVSLSLALPDDLNSFVEAEAARHGFATVSDYLRSLILDVQRRQSRRERVDALLLEGLDSGPATALTAADWSDLRTEVRRRHAARQEPPDGPAGATDR